MAVTAALGHPGVALARPAAIDAALDRLCGQVRARGIALDLSGRRFVDEQGANPAFATAGIDARQSVFLCPEGRFLPRTSTVYPGGIEFRYRTVGTLQGLTTVDDLG